MEAYSRDAQAAPLRLLDNVLRKIRIGEFAPDSTRSGFIVKKTAKARDGSVSSDSSVAVSASSVDPEPEDKDDADAAPPPQDRYIRNARTKRIHVQLADGTLSCECEVPRNFSVLSELPPPPARLCTRCF